MARRFPLLTLTLTLALSLAAAAPLLAETVKGRISNISNKASTIQIDVADQGAVVVGFNADTRFIDAAGIADLGPPDLIKVEFEPGKPATSITKVLFNLPPGVEIDINRMLEILTSGEPYALFDARPKKRYLESHVPSAQHAFPKDEDFLSRLPKDKSQLVVFYCGGPTCPFTGQAVEQASAAGYTNLKGFQAGIPGWKKFKLPVHSSPEWVEQANNPQHVVIDVRPVEASTAAHLPGAVAMPAAEFMNLREQFIARDVKAALPGVTDKRAPVILYSDNHTDPNVLLAYKELREWGYKQVSILEGGLGQWTAAGRPVESGPATREIVYVKKLAPGAVSTEEFVALEKSRDGVVFLDVRTAAETAGGMLAGATHIPLDAVDASLDQLPRDQEIIVYCANGIRAEMTWRKLKEQGFQVRFLNEEITFTKDGGYSI